MADYAQFCTVARGAEILGERWTALVVRELLCGSTRFNEIRRGVPRMSPTLLAERLRKLEDAGIVARTRSGKSSQYRLTQAGEELRPIIVALGHWGARWIGSRLKRDELDAGFLMWDIRRFARAEKFPRDRRTVIHIRFRDARPGEKRWWLVVERGEVDLCRDDPGHEVTLVIDTTVRALTEIWTGDSDAATQIAAGRVDVIGLERDTRSVWDWIGRSMFAATREAARNARPQRG